MTFTIAIAGNPNVGKSTIFNALTGAKQHVGNWPGKTVEKKHGKFSRQGQEITVVDLPGIYSLTAFSIEEIIARDFIVDEQPNAVVIIVDAANLERNLYLVLQLLETKVPLILGLNMSDVAETQGIRIDDAKLSEALDGIPIVRLIGSKRVGVEELKEAIVALTLPQQNQESSLKLVFNEVVESEIENLVQFMEADSISPLYPKRWLAIKLLEEDTDILKKFAVYPQLIEASESAVARILEITGEDTDTLIADGRYTFIGDLIKSAVHRPTTNRRNFSDNLDVVLTHRLFGIPIFLFFMWVVFQFTANVSAPYLDWIDGIINGLVMNQTTRLLMGIGIEDTWFGALVLNGIIAGVGGILVFIPVLLSLYFAIAILEDTGYMARAAFVMDRLMRLLGLHGKSFLPLLVGFGCTVPAVYATRTLENETDRKITAFLATFMSCGARLPVYVVFGAAFFGASAGNFIFAMYLLGIGVAIMTSLLLTRIVFKNKPTPPLVMELPPYRVPNLRTVLSQMWERTTSFVRNAGTIILVASIVIWFLMALPVDKGRFNDVEPEDSLFGQVSRLITPVFAPAGFDDWKMTGSLVTGFIAKEVVVSSMSQIYVGEAESETSEEIPPLGDDLQSGAEDFGTATLLTGQEMVNIAPRTANLLPFVAIQEASFVAVDEEEEDHTSLEAALQKTLDPLSALAFNVFILLYVPCMAAVGAMRHEFGWRWMVWQMLYTSIIAWLGAVLVYQLGSLLGF